MTDNAYHTLPKSADQYLTEARLQTGIDIQDTEIRETLERFIDSVNREAKLSAKGLVGFELWLPRVLRDRLRVQRDLRAHPEILQQKIVRPLIMTGGPRSGSTKLHKLLGAGGDFKVLYCWQAMCPALHSGNRLEDPTPRVRETDAWVRWFDTSSPTAKLSHHLSTLEIEEENPIFDHVLLPHYVLPWLNVPSYMEWYMAQRFQAFRPALRYMKQVIQYVQWQFHQHDPRPWILKSPAYPGFEAQLQEEFPDAVFVSTHRDPLPVISSGNSLITSYHLAYSDITWGNDIILGMVEGLTLTWQQYIAMRDARPDINVLDIGYQDTTKRAEQVVERIYAHAGMTLSDRARAAMRAWDAENSQHKLGRHAHTAEGTPVTPEMVYKRFEFYRERYGAYW